MNGVTWLPIAILSYLLSAINSTADRAILNKHGIKPIEVSFIVSLFSVVTTGLLLIGFLPVSFANSFMFQQGDLGIMILAILLGYTGQLSLLFLYKALEKGEVTKVISVLGSLVPVVSFVAAYIFLGERLGLIATTGFILLILATIVLTSKASRSRSRGPLKWVPHVLVASILFGSQAVLAKHVYDNYHFISAYSLSGIGAGLYTLTLTFFSKKVRAEISKIFHKKNKSKVQSKKSLRFILVILNSIIGGVAVILINYAISQGSPTLVGALRGVQYAGIFIIALIMSKIYPKLLDEDLSKRAVIIKSLGIMLTISGIALLAI